LHDTPFRKGFEHLAYTWIFGPVRSGRLGLSLGVDLLGEKACSYDCLYCEVCPTTKLTTKRQVFAPILELTEEMQRWRDEASSLPDHITLGGMGEPCLHIHLAEIIAAAKDIFPTVPVAVLSNSSLLGDPQLRKELSAADVVLPSMDSLKPESFAFLNRPHPSLSVEAVARGIKDFREEYDGRMYLEVLLAEGVNDDARHLELMRDYVAELRPDRVDAVTVTRPGAHTGADPALRDDVAHWRAVLNENFPPEHSGTDGSDVRSMRSSAQILPPEAGEDGLHKALAAEIFASISRRPQTARQLALALDAPEEQVVSLLDAMAQEGKADRREESGEHFYSARRSSD
jgi:wyosine [tRNA(Phe)-imidazoG37] synthetase (radical SAM superfamily)